MKFSLLYKNIPEEEYRPYGEESALSDVVYDLSIDKTVNRLFADSRRTDYFLSVVRRPLTDVEEIRYRQHIFADFLAFPELFDQLKLIFTRYDKIKSDWVELRSGVYPANSGSSSAALLDHTFSSLKVTAIFPRTIISFYEAISETLEKFDVKSEGLREMRKFCGEMVENNSLNEIAEIAGLFQYNTPEEYNFDAVCELDATLRLAGCDLSRITEKPKKGLGWNLFKKKKTDANAPREVKAAPEALDNSRHILTEALYHIDTALSAITSSIYDGFYGIARELMFYEVGLACANAFHALDIPLCLPDVRPAEDDLIDCVGLRDMLLASEGKDGRAIVPNDVRIGSRDDGMLIRGANNSGKTTFLRSLGSAQLFAQAGLPVCASEAHFSVRSGVYTHFSAAEEDFTEGDTSGRFEGEVRIMARMMDELKPYSLVLLNETFQTTSYSEGAQGMYNILAVFPKMGTKYIFVTHLLKLYELLEGSGAMLMQSGGEDAKYRIGRAE